MLMMSACESVRTVYDEGGNVVEEQESSGGETDLSARLEKQFNSSFSTKKTEDGVPLSVSNKVSRYQRDIDESRRMEKDFHTEAFGGAKEDFYTMSFAGADKSFTPAEAYSGGLGKRIERDLHPDFATPSRGIFGTDDLFAEHDRRASGEGSSFGDAARVYGGTHRSVYSREASSGYVETRRDRTPPPRIISRDQYQRKTIDETRALLGRDN